MLVVLYLYNHEEDEDGCHVVKQKAATDGTRSGFQGTLTEGHWNSRLPKRLQRRLLSSVEFRPLENAHVSDDSSTGKLRSGWGAWECASYCSRVSPSSSRSTTRVTYNLGCAVEEE